MKPEDAIKMGAMGARALKLDDEMRRREAMTKTLDPDPIYDATLRAFSEAVNEQMKGGTGYLRLGQLIEIGVAVSIGIFRITAKMRRDATPEEAGTEAEWQALSGLGGLYLRTMSYAVARVAREIVGSKVN